MVSPGVKTTPCCPVAVGMSDGLANANDPGTVAFPPERVDCDKDWPAVITDAAGGDVTTENWGQAT